LSFRRQHAIRSNVQEPQNSQVDKDDRVFFLRNAASSGGLLSGDPTTQGKAMAQNQNQSGQQGDQKPGQKPGQQQPGQQQPKPGQGGQQGGGQENQNPQNR
jgi:hypothetical protein